MAGKIGLKLDLQYGLTVNKLEGQLKAFLDTYEGTKCESSPLAIVFR